MADMQRKLEEEEETWQACPPYSTPFYITRLLVRLTPKGVVFSFLFCQHRSGM